MRLDLDRLVAAHLIDSQLLPVQEARLGLALARPRRPRVALWVANGRGRAPPRDCCLGDLTSPSREKEPTDGQKPVQPGHKHKGKGKGKINLVPCLDQQLRETKPRDGVSQ